MPAPYMVMACGRVDSLTLRGARPSHGVRNIGPADRLDSPRSDDVQHAGEKLGQPGKDASCSSGAGVAPMLTPSDRAADVLRRWRALGEGLRDMPHTPAVAWLPVQRMTRAAQAHLAAEGDRLRVLLVRSSQALAPLGEPLLRLLLLALQVGQFLVTRFRGAVIGEFVEQCGQRVQERRVRRRQRQHRLRDAGVRGRDLNRHHGAARVTRSFTPVRMEADLIPWPKLFAAHTVIPSGMTASVEYVT